MSEESAIEFPCTFPITMMGRDSPEFRNTARALVERHAGVVPDEAVQTALTASGSDGVIIYKLKALSPEKLTVMQDVFRGKGKQ